MTFVSITRFVLHERSDPYIVILYVGTIKDIYEEGSPFLNEGVTMDENNPAATSAPAERKARKKKSRRISKTAKAAPARSSRSRPEMAGPSSGVLVAVYILLGLLVIGTSFYTGYLVGQNGGPKMGTGTGAADQPVAMNGKLQIIEYSDYQCPFCGRVEPTIAQLKQQYGDKIELSYKNFPLESIHPNSLNSAIAAECARLQGDTMFWAYHDTLFKNQDSLDVASLKKFAAAVGLDTTKFNTCLDTKATEPTVRADMAEATKHGVQGTPSFWIKDELVVGALPYDNFKTTIDAKLSGKAAPAAAPTPSAPAAPQGKVDVAQGSHVIGDKNAKIKIVEFSDYQCPYCKKFYTDTESQLIDTYVKTGKAQFSYRSFPLSFHQNAQISAEASECVAKLNGNDAYWKFHDMLFTKGNGDGTGLDGASLKQYAATLGVDATKFASCLDNHDTAAAVKADADAGAAAGVSGTPSFYVNGQQLVGAQPFSSFKTAIDAAMAG